ncbi:MAG TPA: hypothetical protein VEY30_05875, partial [Myxococcaceae bacterium]|nr:hypothetical protein [Myxococcaceae bacterium]
MTFHRVRVALLTLTLVLVSAWGAGQYRRRAARTRWTRPLRVSVAVLSRHPVPPDALTAFRQGLGGLETHLAEEFRRYRPGVATPFSLVMAGPAHPDPLPPWAPEGG